MKGGTMLFEDFTSYGRCGLALGADACKELVADVRRKLSDARKEGYAVGLVDAHNDLALQQAYNNGRKDAKMGRSVRESEFLSDRHPDQFRAHPEEQKETPFGAKEEPDPLYKLEAHLSALIREDRKRLVDLEVSLRQNRQLTNATHETHLRRINELEANSKRSLERLGEHARRVGELEADVGRHRETLYGVDGLASAEVPTGAILKGLQAQIKNINARCDELDGRVARALRVAGVLYPTGRDGI